MPLLSERNSLVVSVVSLVVKETTKDTKGLSWNNRYTLARAAAPLRAAVPRHAGVVARSLHTTAGMLVARA